MTSVAFRGFRPSCSGLDPLIAMRGLLAAQFSSVVGPSRRARLDSAAALIATSNVTKVTSRGSSLLLFSSQARLSVRTAGFSFGLCVCVAAFINPFCLLFKTRCALAFLAPITLIIPIILLCLLIALCIICISSYSHYRRDAQFSLRVQRNHSKGHNP
jgi:hypothetical protein